MNQPVIREHHRRLKEVFKTDDLQLMARVIPLRMRSTVTKRVIDVSANIASCNPMKMPRPTGPRRV
jgi:hypothetical protein